MILPRGRKTTIMLASIAAVVALAAAGCSSSSKSSSGTTATTAAPATSASSSPGASTGATTGSTGSTGSAAGGTADGVGQPLSTPTGTPFNLGYICLCGQLQANATLNPAVLRAWISWQNLHGGVNGHPIHLSYFNDPGNPGVALNQVQKMVNSDHIVALIDGDSADDAAWYSYIVKQPVTIYSTGFTSLPMASSTSPNVFEMAVSQYYLFDEIMLAAQKVGGHKMAVLYCAENPACKQTVAPLTTAGKQFNIPVVFNASVLASAPNYTAQCLAAKQAGADVMFIADGAAVTVSVAASCATQGYTPHQVSDEGAYNQSIAGKSGWDGFLGSQDVIPFFVTSTPGSKLMHDTIAQYAPGAAHQLAVERHQRVPLDDRPADQPGGEGRWGRHDPTLDRDCSDRRHVQPALHQPQRDDADADVHPGRGEPAPLLVLGWHPERQVVPAVRLDADLRRDQQDQLTRRVSQHGHSGAGLRTRPAPSSCACTIADSLRFGRFGLPGTWTQTACSLDNSVADGSETLGPLDRGVPINRLTTRPGRGTEIWQECWMVG